MEIQREDNKSRCEVKLSCVNPTVTMVALDPLPNSSSRCGEDEKVPLLSKDQMREVHLGSHTIRSHGVQVARNHMHDWLILLVLIIFDVILNIIHPFYRFVGEDMMSDLKYPLKSNTVPFWAVPMIAILLPMGIILLYYVYRKDVYDLHHAILGLLFSVLVTAVITDAIKNAVGRPRPDFFWRCFPDGIGVYDHVTRNVVCHGNKRVIKEGHKSFPSGHTSSLLLHIGDSLLLMLVESLMYGAVPKYIKHKQIKPPGKANAGSFAGLAFLSLYLSGKIKAFDQSGHIAKLCIVFLPLLAAALVGISRVDDYWHHWQDVFAGGLLGFVVAMFCYLQFFPAPHRTDGENKKFYALLVWLFKILGHCWMLYTDWFLGYALTLQHFGWGPYAYFQMLTESRRTVEQPVTANSACTQTREMEIVDQQAHTATATNASSARVNGAEAV